MFYHLLRDYFLNFKALKLSDILSYPIGRTVEGLDVLRVQLDQMFGDGDPAQVCTPHDLELFEHCQKVFAIASVFIGQMNVLFQIMLHFFAVGLFDRVVLFHLGVTVVSRFVVSSRDDVLFIVPASSRRSIAAVLFAVN